MKQKMAWLLCVVLLLSALFGCSSKQQMGQADGIEFFYRSADPSYTSTTGIMASEHRVFEIEPKTLFDF